MIDKQINVKKHGSDMLITAVLSFIVFFTPLIVFLRVITLSEDASQYWMGQGYSFDFFSYYKMRAFVVFSVILLISFVYKVIIGDIKIKKTKFYIPFIAYLVFIILSTILSEHILISVYGYVERYEGMIVLIFYIIDAFIAINIIENDKSIKIVLFSLICSSLIISIIGLFQFLGYDFFQSGMGKKLILPSEYKQYAANLKFSFPKGTVYGTLYNPDYMGSYMGMVIGLLFIMYICFKNKSYKILSGFLCLLAFVSMLGSGSRAGLLAITVSLILGMIFTRKKLKENIMWIVIPLIIFVGVFTVVNVKQKGVMVSKIKTSFSDIGKLAKGSNYDRQNMGSARGYIWGKSVGLLKNTVIKGHGPDTFIAYFPQNDSNRKVLKGLIIDKPHNMYLQIGINTGITSLIAVAALFIMYIVLSFKLYFNSSFDDFYSISGLAIFIAFIAYIVAGFFNDSFIAVAPIFWILFGTGIGINMKNGK